MSTQVAAILSAIKSLGLVLPIVLLVISSGCNRASRQEAPKETTIEGKTLAEWTTLAKGGDPELRAKALGVLAGSDPEIVIALLRHQQAEVRKAALDTVVHHDLGRQQAGAAVPALTQLLRDQDPGVRGIAAVALGNLGSAAQSAIPALTELLRDENKGVRSGAAGALGKFGPAAKGAIPALLGLIRAKRNRVRDLSWFTAAETLASLGPEGRSAGTEALLEILRDEDEDELVRNSAHLLRKMNPEAKAAIPDLAKLLRHEDRSIRKTAAFAFGFVGPDATVAVPALMDSLRDTDWEVVCMAAWALGKARAETGAAIPALTDLLQDQRPLVQASAAEALVSQGPPTSSKGVTALIQLLHHQDSQVRLAAARSLCDKGSRAREAIPALTESLRDCEPDVRATAATALGAMRAEAKPAVMAIAELLRDPDRHVRGAAVRTLESIGPDAREAIPTFNDMLQQEKDEWTRTAAAAALRKIQQEESIPTEKSGP